MARQKSVRATNGYLRGPGLGLQHEALVVSDDNMAAWAIPTWVVSASTQSQDVLPV